MLQSVGSLRVTHNLVTAQQQQIDVSGFDPQSHSLPPLTYIICFVLDDQISN